MDDTVSVAMICCKDDLLHVVSCSLLSEAHFLLLDYFVKKLNSVYELHDQVDVLYIVISFIILNNVWVVKCVEGCNFLYDHIKVSSNLFFDQHFYRNIQWNVYFIISFENFAKLTLAKNNRFPWDVVVFSELLNTLLSLAFV